MSPARLTACVMLPFAAGYFLSYLFCTINAIIATDLAADLHLGAADLGFLISIYFLIFAAVQLPFGALLDRHGPKLIQSALLLLASAGSLVFALADGLAGLVIGRGLVALGVALALMAGFKAIVVWFPPRRVVLANGWLVMLGALGAVSANAPAEILVRSIGWRGLFAVLAGLSALAALLVLIAVPDQTLEQPRQSNVPAASLWAAYRDRRFWRIAPLSAVGVGTSWSLQDLWAAPWLRDVEGLDRATIVQHLSGMAIAVCLAALLFGTAASRLRYGLHDGIDVGRDGRPVGDGPNCPGPRLANSFACPLDRHRSNRSGYGAELRNPRRILSPGGLWPRERRPQSAARERGFCAAVGHGHHHRPVAPDQWWLCRRGPRSSHDRRYLCSVAVARLVHIA
jgi:MFS family permease